MVLHQTASPTCIFFVLAHCSAGRVSAGEQARYGRCAGEFQGLELLGDGGDEFGLEATSSREHSAN